MEMLCPGLQGLKKKTHLPDDRPFLISNSWNMLTGPPLSRGWNITNACGGQCHEEVTDKLVPSFVLSNKSNRHLQSTELSFVTNCPPLSLSAGISTHWVYHTALHSRSERITGL